MTSRDGFPYLLCGQVLPALPLLLYPEESERGEEQGQGEGGGQLWHYISPAQVRGRSRGLRGGGAVEGGIKGTGKGGIEEAETGGIDGAG